MNYDGSWLANGYGSLMDGGAPGAALGFQLEPSLGARFFVKKSCEDGGTASDRAGLGSSFPT